jgi:glucose/arabinose dehydrogenase
MKDKTLTLLLLLVTTFSFSQDIYTILFADGFSNPVEMQNVGDDRLFIVEKRGVIEILQLDGTTNPTPFLDIQSIVLTPGGNYDERGLLGLAFHPDYINNGYFYVNYIDNFGNTQISRFSVSTSDPNIADPDSEFQILEVEQPYINHNGGCLRFGPEGYLYIGLGDGGSAGDPENRSQNLQTLLGKMLRIDIDNTEGSNNYAVPSNNPFVEDPNALDEIWSYGLRNPWRFSFDYETDELWIGDVGQGSMEEIDRAAAGVSGQNYGWRCYEGTLEYNTYGCPNESEMTFPIAEYTHAGGNCSITGGSVYRGEIYADILGVYFYADYCSGEIGTIDQSNNQINHGQFNGSWVSFGEDKNKELYILDNLGSIYKIEGSILSTTDFNTNTISIYPNPASDNLNIKSTNNNLIKSISIYDLKGSTVLTKDNIGISENNISINSLLSGIYMVNVISVKGISIIKKLIVK